MEDISLRITPIGNTMTLFLQLGSYLIGPRKVMPNNLPRGLK